ncbi:hypothetical protein F4604DRAFT_1687384 [Suillus subluteus]|nr:hypothetical protein F4604DRAFT_1687384 [Suillus subluteus]
MHVAGIVLDVLVDFLKVIIIYVFVSLHNRMDISSTRAGLVLKWVNMEDLRVYSPQHKPGPVRLHYPRSASSKVSLDAERGGFSEGHYDISSTRAGLVLKWVNMEDLCVYSRQHNTGPVKLHYPRSASSSFALDAERG